MEALAPLLVVVLLGVVVLVVWLPLRPGRVEAVEGAEREQIADLLAAKEAKYREIRDLELDMRTGKLSREDFRLQDRARRAEAVALLRRLDALGYGETSTGDAADGPPQPEPEREREPASVAAEPGPRLPSS